jgi:hypothetical protein
MRTVLALAIAAIGLGIIAVSAAVFGVRAPVHPGVVDLAWTEAKWPFPIDQWGIGRAFACAPEDCGAKVDLYVRPKIGFCNCATGVSDDAELERVADVELLRVRSRPAGPGRPIKVGWMRGLSRSYLAPEGAAGENVVSVAYNDQCDVVVAVARLGSGDPAVLEPAIVAFLNTNPMVLWAKTELGLEFIKREW